MDAHRNAGVAGLFACLAALAVSAPEAHAASVSWRAQEGACAEWAGPWTLTSQGGGRWSGRIDYRMTGGKCVRGDGQRFSADVELQIDGGRWRARRFNSSDHNDCRYRGEVVGGELHGTNSCDNGGSARVEIDMNSGLAPRR